MKCYEVKKLKKLDKMSIRCYYNNITTNMEVRNKNLYLNRGMRGYNPYIEF